ncbi:MAG: glycosyltransferase 87 family protein [Nakamurella sp.]
MSKRADQGTARPAVDPSATDPSATLDPYERVVPSWTDPTVRRASQSIGGPLGHHAQVGRLLVLTPLRVCLLMALLFLLFGWLAKSPCIQQTAGANGTFVLDSSANRQWISGCYNDVVPAYQIHGLNQSISPFATHYASDGTVMPSLPYSALTAAFMWLVARVTGAYLKIADGTGLLPAPLDVGAFFTFGAVALGLIYLWAVASTLKISRRRPWDTAIMCLSPLLVVHAFTNWDILPIALLAAAMLSWSRSRTVWAGVFLGLAVAAKLYPVLFLVPLVVLALRTGRQRPVLQTTLTAVLAWLAVNLPFMLTDPTAWSRFYATNVDRRPEFTTLWSVFSSWSGSTLLTRDPAPGQAPELLNAIVAVLLVVAVLLIGWLGLAASRRPRLAQLMFLTVAAFLLITKTWNPQFSLWLLPLAVLALPHWRPLLVWQLAEAALWWLLMLTFGTRGDSTARYALISAYPFQTVALVRDGLVIMLMVMVIREILRPALDPVRQAGDDDPTGGVFTDAPDRLSLPSLPALLGFGRVHPASPEAFGDPVFDRVGDGDDVVTSPRE